MQSRCYLLHILRPRLASCRPRLRHPVSLMRGCVAGYPNSYGPGKNSPYRVATQDVAWVRWAQLGSMPTGEPSIAEQSRVACFHRLLTMPAGAF